MFFRNVTLFRFPAGNALDGQDPSGLGIESLSARLRKHALKPCGPLEMHSRGWVPPHGRFDGTGEESLYVQRGRMLLLTLGIEQKLLPAAVVNEALAEKLAALAEERGKPVGGRERKRLKDEVLHDLLPKAFVKPARLSAYFDLDDGWVAIDTASQRAAAALLTTLRETLGSFVAIPLDPEESPRSLMTGWLSGATRPDLLELGSDCDLLDPVDTGGRAALRKVDLDGEEVREHLKAGKQCARLGLVHADRVSFHLDEALTLRKVRMLDVVTEELESSERDSPAAELDARFALMTLTLEPVLELLEATFKLTRPRNR